MLPVERLHQLVDEGMVGGIGPTVYSINGYATHWHEVERRGIPTRSLSNLQARSLVLKLPRVLVSRLPGGMTAGAPDDVVGQRDLLRAVLRLLPAPNADIGRGEYHPDEA